MAKIYPFPSEGTRIDRSAVLAGLRDQQDSGDLQSFMYFAEGRDGTTRYGVYGGFADRLQFAAHTLVQALNTVSNRIAESGTAGHTESPSIRATIPRRPMPRDLTVSP